MGGLLSFLLLGGPLRCGPIGSLFRVLPLLGSWSSASTPFGATGSGSHSSHGPPSVPSSRTHQVGQATFFQLVLVRQLFIRIPHRIVLRNLIFSDIRPLELMDHLFCPPICFESFPQTRCHAMVLIPCDKRLGQTLYCRVTWNG